MSAERPHLTELEYKVIRSKKPAIIGKVPNPKEFSHGLVETYGKGHAIWSSELDLADTNFDIHENLARFKPTIQIIANYELSRNPHALNPQLTIAQDWFLGHRRRSITHFDYYGPCAIYAVANRNPTEFFVQSYKVPRNATPNDIAPIIREESNSSSIWRPKPYEIVLFDQTAHRIPTKLTLRKRTFLKVSFFRPIN